MGHLDRPDSSAAAELALQASSRELAAAAAAAAMGSDYYSVSSLLAEETYVPVRLVHGCTGEGLGPRIIQ